MSIGFPAHAAASQRFKLDQKQLIELAGEALTSLGLSYERPFPNRFLARTAFGFWSVGERLVVEVESDGTVTVRSECLMPTQMLDWGRNRRNVNAVFQYIASAACAYDTVAVGPNAT